MSRCQPSSASARHKAAPIRLAPPVTIAVRGPSNSLAMAPDRMRGRTQAAGPARPYPPARAVCPGLAGADESACRRPPRQSPHADAAPRRPRRPFACRDRAAGGGEEAAPGRQVEPVPLRRQRDAHRPRRHLVSSGQPDRAPGDGPPVLDHPEARARRPLRPGHSGREARHRGRGRAVRRRRAQGRRRRRGDVARLPAQHRRPRHRRPRPSPAVRGRAGRARTPISGSAAGSTRWSPARSITSWPSSPSPAAIRPACGAAAPSSRWKRRDRPRRAASRRARAGAPAPADPARRRRARGRRRGRSHCRRRCWWRWSTIPRRP